MNTPDEPAGAERLPATQRAGRARNATATRQRLLDAARSRFARDGYGATTVRDIATDAGVNVALINRYFSSKEGLFEACITDAGKHLSRHRREDMTARGDVTVAGIADTILQRLGELPSAADSVQILLLLQRSGDERADELRRKILRSFAERMAAASGWAAGETDTDAALLRAQVALAAVLGVVHLRSTTGLQPLAAATDTDLEGPVRDLLTALLTPTELPRVWASD
ncbi:TetR/AcrR family transcriptional regulator [Microbacterium saperdae]|uniref:TetR family transcriptional regulator n=1 Tax=Microbacterium saperdae TaxID=69368 RepID=A0A543BL55_9MICO|nr:TetR/AcrR family transcriptional regulator [Microbacterium saperdae]TQL85544.1 TetR family transcriptional regulator [Microbacterium saperdae]GGM62925.1 TetR family transcriptional regulator [Microbacterium saperdae]